MPTLTAFFCNAYGFLFFACCQMLTSRTSGLAFKQRPNSSQKSFQVANDGILLENETVRE